MNIPDKLRLELADSKSHVPENGDFPAIRRKKILQLIEELSVPEHASAGYLRRARLASVCAYASLPLLGEHKEVSSDALKIISNGLLALSGKHDLKLLEAENGRFHTKVVNLLEHGDKALISVYAGMTCFSAVNTILYDTNFDTVGESEGNISPDDCDPSFYGSLAASGSAVWEAKNGDVERVKYWFWYLETAIPLAWNVEMSLD